MFIEDDKTELKVELNREIRKEIIGFANASGGTIYVGIDDYGNVVGLTDIKKDTETVTGLIQQGISPDLMAYVNIKQIKIEDKDVLELDIKETPNKPYYLTSKGPISEGAFVRYGNTIRKMSGDLIKRLIYESMSDSFELALTVNQDLHFDYLNKVFKEKSIELNDASFKTFRLLDEDGYYTNLALLLSDECPYSIKVASFFGTTVKNFRDRREFTGSLFKQLEDACEYINLYNQTKGVIKGLERIDTKDYPIEAIRESLLNAIVHRDYSLGDNFLVYIFDDHIEVTSLGGLVKGITLEDIYQGVSKSRNPNLANIFFRLHYVEAFGTGIRRMKEEYNGQDRKVEISVTENTFKVNLPNRNYIGEKNIGKNLDNKSLSEEDIATSLFIGDNKVTRKDIERSLSVSKSKAYSIVSSLISKGVIKQVGSDKNTFYTLVD